MRSILKKDLEAFHDEEDLDHSSYDCASVDLSSSRTSSFRNNSSTNTANNSEAAVIQILGHRESKAVVGFRMLVFGVLFLSMVLVAVVTYLYTSGAEQREFQRSFDQDARKVLESLGASLDKAIAGVDAYVISLLSYARDTNQTWPFVTVPDFEARSGKFLDLTKAVVFMQFLLVTPETRDQWEQYTAKEGREWSGKSVDYLQQNNLFQDVYEARNITDESIQTLYIDMVHDYSAWGVEDPQGLPATHPGPMLPMWQSAPLIPTTPVYNWDLATVAENESVLHCIQQHEVAISRAYMAGDNGDPAVAEENAAWADYFSSYIDPHEEAMEPLSDFYYPMVEDMLDWRDLSTRADYDPTQHKVAGILSQSVYWRDMIKGILPDGSDGIVAVFESPCSMSFTYEINGPNVKYMGGGDHHNPQYDSHGKASLLQDLDEYNAGANKYSYIPLERDLCPWTVRVFPSEDYESNYVSNLPVYFTAAAVIIFAFTTAVFVFYDWWVERRQRIVMESALRSNAIVSSLFPSNVRDRLYNQEKEDEGKNKKETTFLNKQQSTMNGMNNKDSSLPIADLFPEVTVLFADLVGFTAWSSSREPSQVFILLENLYGAFDKIAKRRGVFKIETIGDCYVAVSGLPEPRKNHAVVLCRFAADIRELMNSITKDLEHQLGPGTGDLQIRIGCNSGAVTAGVLRMDKSRFQLFGDTVNTAARMESNGKPNRIQVSQKTAEKLEEAGKGMWLTERPDPIQAKGKGTMKTFWVEPAAGASTRQSGASTILSSDHSESEKDAIDRLLTLSNNPSSAVTERLIEWNAKIFEDLIKQVVAHRQTFGEQQVSQYVVAWQQPQSKNVRQEVVDTVKLPAFRKATSTVAPETLELEPQVVQQLHSFIADIAHTYRPNAFHNFQHASHVTMSTNKLLHQIVNHSNTLSQQEVYIHSFGVAMDPLAQLAIVFSALIHDVDHRGVPNPVLAKEEPLMAKRYENGSVAEQNSVDIAWEILRRDFYKDLWACLFPNEAELARFRQLVVNAVIATDVFDPELKSMRNDRWQRVFSASADSDDPDYLNSKATIVLEHVIQASDIVHTVQHWTIYQKWNHRLFEEMYGAFLLGRTDKDPSEGWYNGEIWFFDNYVIPLAKKLKECQVFGASGHEYLDTAYENRIEWEQKGKGIVEQLKEKMDSRFHSTSFTAPQEESWTNSHEINTIDEGSHHNVGLNDWRKGVTKEVEC